MPSGSALGLAGALQIGRLIDAGIDAPEMISRIKRDDCAKGLGIGRSARHARRQRYPDQVGIVHPVHNPESVNTYDGTHDVHALVLGRAQTGIQAFH
ncbi:Glutaryl-CoA dehydrogenase [Salinisphaera sp. LB1]|nr:Glutaryl-CoA dehydrogenase [Salinisphaera sp. LB1]